MPIGIVDVAHQRLKATRRHPLPPPCHARSANAYALAVQGAVLRLTNELPLIKEYVSSQFL
eukprot:1381406-Amorphochlora_amoeboformis.AAC.2